MERTETGLALGLMSGTSMDGIDAAIIETDGRDHVRPVASLAVPYPRSLRDKVAAVLPLARALDAPAPLPDSLVQLEAEITAVQAEAVRSLLTEARIEPASLRVIGFHGQTVAHRPDAGWTLQLGDGEALAAATGVDVVNDFRSADMAAGGEGAPFAPLYHLALSAGVDARPLGVLNLGGVGNATWIGADGTDPIAFDTGPANALIDEWALRHLGEPYDRDGALAASGSIDEAALAQLLDNPYFDRPPPKSLDRLDFDAAAVDALTAADGAATLTAFTVESVARAVTHMPAAPVRWIVCGGGRRNPVLMAALQRRLSVPVVPAEDAGWRGDVLEAEAFAYLAMRSLEGLPLSLPTTTGARSPVTGGRLHRAPARAA